MQDGQQPNEPGWVFKPGENNQQTAELPPLSTTPPAQPISQAESTPEITAPITEPLPPAPVQPQSPEADYSESPGHIEWTASEYVASPKSAGWYTLLALGSIILAVIVYFITQELLPTIVIALLGIIVGVFAARQPQTLQYAIDTTGLHIGGKHYPYASFKAFSIAREQAIGFIQLLPLKRFMPPLVIHYAPEDEDRIAETLADYLPYEEHKVDVVDNLTRRLRF